jgi:hypothetical protein
MRTETEHGHPTRAVAVAFGAALALRVFLGAIPAYAVSFPVVAPGRPSLGCLGEVD